MLRFIGDVYLDRVVRVPAALRDHLVLNLEAPLSAAITPVPGKVNLKTAASPSRIEVKPRLLKTAPFQTPPSRSQIHGKALVLEGTRDERLVIAQSMPYSQS